MNTFVVYTKAHRKALIVIPYTVKFHSIIPHQTLVLNPFKVFNLIGKLFYFAVVVWLKLNLQKEKDWAEKNWAEKNWAEKTSAEKVDLKEKFMDSSRTSV